MFDTLLSLSFLPFLFTTGTAPSWSTSLNLLFFYLTWTTLLLSHPPLRIELIGTAAIRILAFVLPSLLFSSFDYLIPSLSVSLKIQGKRGLARSIPAGRKARMAAWSLINAVVVPVAVMAAVELGLRELKFRSALRAASTLPLPGELVWSIAKAVCVRETLSYVLHRSLHTSRSYAARKHRTWAHEIAVPFPLAAAYDHPLPYLVHKFLPVFVPAVVWRFHLLTWYLWLAVVSVEEAVAGSGYGVVWSLLGGVARRTDRHYAEGGEGNWSAWGVIDWVCGTGAGSSLTEEEEEEEESEEEERRRKRSRVRRRK